MIGNVFIISYLYSHFACMHLGPLKSTGTVIRDTSLVNMAEHSSLHFESNLTLSKTSSRRKKQEDRNGDNSVIIQGYPTLFRLLTLTLHLAGDFMSIKVRDDLLPHIHTILHYFLHIRLQQSHIDISGTPDSKVRSHEDARVLSMLKFMLEMSQTPSLRSLMMKASLKFAWLTIQFLLNDKVAYKHTYIHTCIPIYIHIHA